MEMKLNLFALVCLLLLADRTCNGIEVEPDYQGEVYEVTPLQNSYELLTPKVRNKRTISSIGNLLAINLFPIPLFPTNFIGLQVTIVPPKNRNGKTSGRRGWECLYNKKLFDPLRNVWLVLMSCTCPSSLIPEPGTAVIFSSTMRVLTAETSSIFRCQN